MHTPPNFAPQFGTTLTEPDSSLRCHIARTQPTPYDGLPVRRHSLMYDGLPVCRRTPTVRRTSSPSPHPTPYDGLPVRRIDQGHRAGGRDFPVQNRMIRPLWCTDLFATVAECSHGRQAGRGDRWTTKHTKSTKVSEKEAFEAMLSFRPEVPVNRDRTTAHSIRHNVEFQLRDLRVLRGCSNGVRWSTPCVANVIIIGLKVRAWLPILYSVPAPRSRATKLVTASRSHGE